MPLRRALSKLIKQKQGWPVKSSKILRHHHFAAFAVSPNLRISISPYLHISISPYLQSPYLHISISPYLRISTWPPTTATDHVAVAGVVPVDVYPTLVRPILTFSSNIKCVFNLFSPQGWKQAPRAPPLKQGTPEVESSASRSSPGVPSQQRLFNLSQTFDI
jgi:hypothetical protein